MIGVIVTVGSTIKPIKTFKVKGFPMENWEGVISSWDSIKFAKNKTSDICSLFKVLVENKTHLSDHQKLFASGMLKSFKNKGLSKKQVVALAGMVQSVIVAKYLN